MNPYEVLGVKITDSKDEIKKKYRQLIMQNHPDKTQNNDDTKFKQIQEAYERISSDDIYMDADPMEMFNMMSDQFTSGFQIFQAMLNGVTRTSEGVTVQLPNGKKIFFK